jgi:RNA polymerase sigma-70 factor (ECF subfamily)
MLNDSGEPRRGTSVAIALRDLHVRRAVGRRRARPQQRNGKCRTMAFSIDSSTLEDAANGDSVALRTLVTTLKPRIEKQLLRYPLAEEDRRDLAQATLMQVIRRVGSFRGDSSFSTWLFRVTANEALMMMRSQRRHRARLVEGLDLEDLGSLPAANDAAGDQRAETNAAASERDARVRQALEELPPGYRDVVALHYHQDLGLHEIAARLSTTESAVRSRLHRARSRLRAILERGVLGHEIAAA